jgi:hypothetical protein
MFSGQPRASLAIDLQLLHHVVQARLNTSGMFDFDQDRD